MATCALSGTIAKAIEAYTGKPVTHVEAFADPHVRGVFAVRAQFGRLGEHHSVDFLISAPLRTLCADDLSEASFTDWPPNTRG